MTLLDAANPWVILVDGIYPSDCATRSSHAIISERSWASKSNLGCCTTTLQYMSTRLKGPIRASLPVFKLLARDISENGNKAALECRV